MVRKILRLFVLCLVFGQRVLAGPESPETLAEGFLASVSDQRGSLFPSELVYPDNLAQLTDEQLVILRFMPAVRLFNRSDLKYRIAAANASRRHQGLDYPYPPSRVILISHANWQPDVPVLSLDITKIDGCWWIVVPKLSAELVEIVRTGIDRHELQVKELAARVPPGEIVRFREVMGAPGKYDLIEELAQRFNVSIEAAILFLSELKKLDEDEKTEKRVKD